MKKNRCNVIILFTIIILSIPILAFADNRQTAGQIPVNYLQWQSNNVSPLMHPTLLIVQQKFTFDWLQGYLDQLPQSADYRGFMALPHKTISLDTDYVIITGDEFHLVNIFISDKPIPLVVEQKTDNHDLQRYIDNLPFSDSYRGFIHLPQLDSIAGDNYIVMAGNNYYLVTLLAEEYLSAPVVEQKIDNPYLQQYIDNLPTPTSYQGFMHLPKKDRVFDSYIVLEGSNHHLVNILEDGTLFSQPNIAKHWSQDEQEKNNHWTIYTIDESLNLKVTEAIIHYSQQQKKFLITRKISEQRYRVNDVGTMIKISDKPFPNVVTKHDPTNLDNCLDLSISFGVYLSISYEDHILPLPVSNYYNFYPDIYSYEYEPGGIVVSADCFDNVIHSYVVLPKRYSSNVIRYVGYEHQNEDDEDKVYATEYLATADDNGLIRDIMVISFDGSDKQRKISYTINRDYSIDLTMTEPDGKTLTQSYQINQQGEFE